MKIGDIVYLAEPVKWRRTLEGDWNEHIYPIGTPVEIINCSSRGYDIKFVETEVEMHECMFVKFSETNPFENKVIMKEKIICIINSDTTELNKYLEEGWAIRDMTSSGCYTHTVCYVRLSK